MNNQSERVVLITGGSSGIGLEMAKQMSEQNSTVIICSRSKEKLEAAKKRIPGLFIIQCDITKIEDRKKLFNIINEKFNNLNMLMNNAGIAERFIFAKTDDLENKIMKEWQTNYMAPILLSKEFLPLLIKNKGSIVNVTSGLVYVPLHIEPNYCATKAALHSMTQSMRLQFSKLGVKVVEIFYPAVDTPFQKGHSPDHAIKPDEAAKIALMEINKGKDEIRVKMAGMLYKLSRLMPKKVLNMINGFIPDNVETLLINQ